MSGRKAQSMSLNVIIIAAIALLVLVILSVIFMGRMGDWSFQSKNCEKQGGTCNSFGCEEGTKEYAGARCYDRDNKIDENMKCCIPLDV